MDEEKQIIAIAEACGWKWYKWAFTPEEDDAYLFPSVKLPDEKGSFVPCDRPSNGIPINFSELPKYTTDLNAMHEAVEFLDRKQKTSFHSVLHRLVGIHNARTGEERYATEATAAQRLEAVLRALNKWEESSITKTPNA